MACLLFKDTKLSSNNKGFFVRVFGGDSLLNCSIVTLLYCVIVGLVLLPRGLARSKFDGSTVESPPKTDQLD